MRQGAVRLGASSLGGGRGADLHREEDAPAISAIIRKGLVGAQPSQLSHFQTVTQAQLFQVNSVNGLA